MVPGNSKIKTLGSLQEEQGPQAEAFRKIVFPFAIAETLVWASYYYSFPALLPAWEADLGFSKMTLTGAFTLSLIVSAVLAPLVGRLIDYGQGRMVFAGGAGLAALLLLLLSQVTEVWQFYAVWFGIGIAMSGSLYEACFAIITYSMGTKAKRAITIVTLIAGFAGTVSFPSAHFLTQFFDWRVTVICYAAIIVIFCIPLILYGCHHASKQAQHSAVKPSVSIRKALVVTRAPTFWLLGLTFCLFAFDHGIVISHMLPLLADRGLTDDLAVLAASMIGPMQVLGRLTMLIFEKHVSVFSICCACFGSVFVASWALFFAGVTPILIIFFVIFQGAGYGVLSIIRPTVISELLGRKDFGIIAGLVSIGYMGGLAFAPIIASLLWEIGGYDIVIMTLIGVPIIAVMSLVSAWKFRPTL